ncbi:MAG: hypothetical protein WA064_02360 [Candidatus Moraniibacteriota bacterium]
MNTVNWESEFYGYKKKTLAGAAILILVAAVMFYAGAKYEKNKLLSLGFAKCEKAPKKAKTPKATTDTSATAPTADGATTTPVEATTNTPADGTAGNLPK